MVSTEIVAIQHKYLYTSENTKYTRKGDTKCQNRNF